MRGLAWAFGFLLVTGCGPTGQKKTTAEPLTLEDGAKHYAEKACAKFQECAPFYIEILFGDSAACKQRFATQLVALYSMPGAGASGDQLAQCSDDMTAPSCNEFLYGHAPTPSCRLPGKRANAASCGSSAQCSSEYCKRASGAECGTCAPLVAAGGTCTSSAECVDDLVCKNGVCATVTYLSAGNACDTSDIASRCGNGTYCKVPSGTRGTCAVPGTLAAACDPDDSDACDNLQALYCDSTAASPTCKRFTMAGPGSPCGVVGSSLVLCRASGDCNTPASAAQGTCTAPVSDGATCGGTQSIPCRYPADCNTRNVCALTGPTCP